MLRGISVVVPTRDRANLWRSGWCLDALLALSPPPLEVLVCSDHSSDDTLAFLSSTLPTRALGCSWTLLDVLAVTPGPLPASATPDNCLFHAANGDRLLHVDDDLRLDPRAIAYALTLPPNQLTWLTLRFVSDAGPLPQQDIRPPKLAARSKPDELNRYRIPDRWLFHWGGAWLAPTEAVRAIGGHDLTHAGLHNSDTRLGNRLVKSGLQSWLSVAPEFTAQHLGQTWHQRNRQDAGAIARSRGPCFGPTIANRGPLFWTSTWFEAAYHVDARFGA